MEKIKPCPFCGSQVRIIRAPMMGTLAFICKECGADVMFYGAEADMKKAKEKWNRRDKNGENG